MASNENNTEALRRDINTISELQNQPIEQSNKNQANCNKNDTNALSTGMGNLNLGDLPIPSDSGDLPIPSDSGDLPIPSDSGDLPIPSDSGDLPIPSDSGDLPIPSGSGDLPIPRSSIGQSSNRTSELEQRNEESEESEESEPSNSEPADVLDSSIYMENEKYTWEIDEVKNNIDNSDPVTSRRFYTGNPGYYMYLHAYFGGIDAKHLSVYCWLMKGQYDVDWPLTCKMTISLVNPKPTGGMYIKTKKKHVKI